MNTIVNKILFCDKQSQWTTICWHMYQVVQKYLTSVWSAEHLVEAEVKPKAKRPEEGGAESGAGRVRVSRSRTCGQTMIIIH